MRAHASSLVIAWPSLQSPKPSALRPSSPAAIAALKSSDSKWSEAEGGEVLRRRPTGEVAEPCRSACCSWDPGRLPARARTSDRLPAPPGLGHSDLVLIAQCVPNFPSSRLRISGMLRQLGNAQESPGCGDNTPSSPNPRETGPKVPCGGPAPGVELSSRTPAKGIGTTRKRRSTRRGNPSRRRGDEAAGTRDEESPIGSVTGTDHRRALATHTLKGPSPFGPAPWWVNARSCRSERFRRCVTSPRLPVGRVHGSCLRSPGVVPASPRARSTQHATSSEAGTTCSGRIEGFAGG
jgi:hypothetical protein